MRSIFHGIASVPATSPLHKWRPVRQKQEWKVGTNRYIPQILLDAITCPRPGYPLLVHVIIYSTGLTVCVKIRSKTEKNKEMLLWKSYTRTILAYMEYWLEMMLWTIYSIIPVHKRTTHNINCIYTKTQIWGHCRVQLFVVNVQAYMQYLSWNHTCCVKFWPGSN